MKPRSGGKLGCLLRHFAVAPIEAAQWRQTYNVAPRQDDSCFKAAQWRQAMTMVFMPLLFLFEAAQKRQIICLLKSVMAAQ